MCVFPKQTLGFCTAPPTLCLHCTQVLCFGTYIKASLLIFFPYFLLKLSSPKFHFCSSEASAIHSFFLACLHPNYFPQYYFLRVVSARSMSPTETFVGPDSPVLKYLGFLLPLIEQAVDRLRLSVTQLLIQRGYPCIPLSLFPEFVYLMGRNDGNDSDGLGNSYPVNWTTGLINADESRIRRDCFIPRTVTLCFKNGRTCAVVRAEENEVYLYKATFRAGLRLPFLRVIRELLSYLNVAHHQIVPNAWRVFFACVVL